MRAQRELTGERVASLWEQAKALVLNGDYATARLIIEHSLPSEVKLIEKMIQQREANADANGMKIKDAP